jgi:hypothetical protein
VRTKKTVSIKKIRREREKRDYWMRHKDIWLVVPPERKKLKEAGLVE